jgi:hypothetical protein
LERLRDASLGQRRLALGGFTPRVSECDLLVALLGERYEPRTRERDRRGGHERLIEIEIGG